MYDDYTIGLRVTDAQGGTGTATTTVTIANAEPVLASIGNKNADELVQLAFTATASDFETLTFSLVGAPSGASITPAGGFTWTPTEAQGPDDYTFTIKVCDDQVPSLCDEEEITVTVNEVNTDPVLDPIGNKSVMELQLLSFTATASDSDLPANTLTFSLVGAPTGASITPAGDFTWTPTEAQAPGTYPFDVCVFDATVSDCETITVTVNTATATHSIDLVAGWNLVSFNVVPADTSIATVLTSITGNYDLVYAWDAAGGHPGSGNWMKFDPTVGFGNTLEDLDETMGFWIHMTAADTLEVEGAVPVSSNIPLSTAVGGWNLVGYPSAAALALPGALSDHGVGDQFNLVYAYHAADTADTWKLFDRTGLPFGNDLDDLEPGWGYWIMVSADNSWNVAYSPE